MKIWDSVYIFIIVLVFRNEFSLKEFILICQEKSQYFLVLLIIDGSFDILISKDDVEEGQDIEVEGEMKEGRDGMGKDILSVEGMDHNKAEHVGKELGQPCPEGQVDVESVLLLPPFDGLCKMFNAKMRF